MNLIFIILKMSGLSILLIGLGFGIAIGIVIGVYIDTDVVIRGKIKQKTGKGGRSDISDITTNLKIDKQLKRTARKQKREQRRLLRKTK